MSPEERDRRTAELDEAERRSLAILARQFGFQSRQYRTAVREYDRRRRELGLSGQ